MALRKYIGKPEMTYALVAVMVMFVIIGYAINNLGWLIVAGGCDVLALANTTILRRNARRARKNSG